MGGHALRMTGLCKKLSSEAEANFRVYIMRKFPPQKI